MEMEKSFFSKNVPAKNHGVWDLREIPIGYVMESWSGELERIEKLSHRGDHGVGFGETVFKISTQNYRWCAGLGRLKTADVVVYGAGGAGG